MVKDTNIAITIEIGDIVIKFTAKDIQALIEFFKTVFALLQKK